MAELNQTFHLSPQFYPSAEEIAHTLQKFGLGNEDITPQTSFRTPPSSSSSYSVYQKNSFETEPTPNGVFPSQSWNNGGGNTVDWSYCDTSCKYVNPYALPSIGNHERIPRINSFGFSSWNDYSSDDDHSTAEDIKKEALEAYKQMKIAEFKNYLKLKGWREEQIEYLEWCKDPILLHEYYGLDIHMMCMNQLGSQYLQNVTRIETAGIILDAVLKGIFQVMRDPSGNLVFQKLVNCCDKEQLQKIVYALSKKHASRVFIDTVMTVNGSKCIQKLIATLKFLKLPMIKMVLYALKPKAFELMMNWQGRKLIQYCMTLPDYDKIQFIYEAVVQNCLVLARDKAGYHVVTTAIETIQGPLRMQLLILLTNHAVYLAQEPNGNFVIQKVIELENPKIISRLCTILEGKIVRLSKNKYGSRFIETCMRSSAVNFVVREILDSEELVQVGRDPFGNYVLQKALENLKDKHHHELFMELVSAIRAVSYLLRRHPHGRIVLMRMGELEKSSAP